MRTSPGAIIATHQPTYPPLYLENNEQQLSCSKSPRTPPMMSWKEDFRAQDLKGLDSSPIDQEQPHALQTGSESRLSQLDTTTTTDAPSTAGTYVTSQWLQRLERFREHWCQDDDSQKYLRTLEITRRDRRDEPYLCENEPKCSAEPKAFAVLWEARKHLQVHIPKGCRPFVCLDCTDCTDRMDFLYPKDLARHLAAAHGISELVDGKPHLERAECMVCDKNFSRRDGLKRHQIKFAGDCVARKRPRRRSAPPANIVVPNPPSLAQGSKQSMPHLGGNLHLRAFVIGSSVATYPTRPSSSFGQMQSTVSSAADSSVHDFETDHRMNIDPVLRHFSNDEEP